MTFSIVASILAFGRARNYGINSHKNDNIEIDIFFH